MTKTTTITCDICNQDITFSATSWEMTLATSDYNQTHLGAENERQRHFCRVCVEKVFGFLHENAYINRKEMEK